MFIKREKVMISKKIMKGLTKTIEMLLGNKIFKMLITNSREKLTTGKLLESSF